MDWLYCPHTQLGDRVTGSLSPVVKMISEIEFALTLIEMCIPNGYDRSTDVTRDSSARCTAAVRRKHNRSKRESSIIKNDIALTR